MHALIFAGTATMRTTIILNIRIYLKFASILKALSKTRHYYNSKLEIKITDEVA
jgi:hypothetical protein